MHLSLLRWDSLLMDLLGANMAGMFLGRWTLMYLETQDYDWSGFIGKKVGFVRRALNQFSPFSWSRYHWEVFSSFKRFAQVCGFVLKNIAFLSLYETDHVGPFRNTGCWIECVLSHQYIEYSQREPYQQVSPFPDILFGYSCCVGGMIFYWIIWPRIILF